MAVLNKIRQRSFFLIIIIALALFAFILADLFKTGGFSGSKAQKVIGEVNGEEISTPAFQNKLEQFSRGRNNMASVNRVWEQMVESELVSQQVEKAGITVDSDHVRGAIEKAYGTDPTFQNEDGVFDYSKVQSFVTEMKETNPQRYQTFWLALEQDLLKSAAADIYFDMVKAGLNYTDKEGEIAYNADNATVNLKYVQLPYTSIADSLVTVSKSEILDYIKKHKSEFTQEANVDIEYVKVDEVASLEDENTISANLKSLVNDTVEYNEQLKSNDTIAGFTTTNNAEEFVNANSDIKYSARFQFKNQLNNELASNLFDAPIGTVHGPYKDGKFMKLAKVVAETKMPDSAKASHILIAWEGLRTGSDVTRTKDDAKKLADSILDVVSKSKSKFKDLAEKFSADKSNSSKGGDLGYFTPGRMVPAFNDYVFQGKTGDKGVVETQFGFHVISIEDQKNLQKAIKIAEIAKEIVPSEKTIGDIYAKVSNFVQSAKSEGFKEAADKNSYNVSPVNGIKELDENIPGAGQQRSIVRWAFNEDNKVGTIKSFEIPSGYFIAKIVKRHEEGLKTVEEASTEVISILRKEKKAELLKEKIKAPDLQSIAVSNGTTVRSAKSVSLKSGSISGAGVEKSVAGAAFGLEKDKVSSPIVGEKGVYVIQVTEMTTPTALASYKGIANKEASNLTRGAQQALIESLKNEADIVDRRAELY